MCTIYEVDCEPGGRILESICEKITRSIKVAFLLSKHSSNIGLCKYVFDLNEIYQIERKGYKPIILKLDDGIIPDLMMKHTTLNIDRDSMDWVPILTNAIDDTTDHLITSRRNIKFVAVPCIDYNRNKKHDVNNCRYPHVCAKFIMNDEPCDKYCDKNHDLVTDQSREILLELGFVTDENGEALLEEYRQRCKKKLTLFADDNVTGPCCYYNHTGCLDGDFHCRFTHICKTWFLGKCNNGNCRFSHDILEPHTKWLLENKFKINTNQPKDAILDEYRLRHPHKQFLHLPPTTNKWHYAILALGVGIHVCFGISVLMSKK